MKHWKSMDLNERKAALLTAKAAGQTAVEMARDYDVQPGVIHHACQASGIELADGYLVKPPFGTGAKAESVAKPGTCSWPLRGLDDHSYGPCGEPVEHGKPYCPEHLEILAERKEMRTRA